MIKTVIYWDNSELRHVYNSDKVEYSNSICKSWITMVCKPVNENGKEKFDAYFVNIGESRSSKRNYYFIYEGFLSH